MKNALIIDDCVDFSEMLSLNLLERDIASWEASSTEEAFEILREETFDIIFCDLHLPFTLGDKINDYLYSEEVGIRTLMELRWVYPDLPIVAMSGAPEVDLLRLTARAGEVLSLAKPLSGLDLDILLGQISRPKFNNIQQLAQH